MGALMRKTSLYIVVIFILSIAVSATAQTQEKTEKQVVTIPQDLLYKIEKAEDDWLEHLEETPEIYTFKEFPDKKSKTKEEIWRYHILQLRDKAKSNREWNEFWKEQEKYTGQIHTLYDQAISFSPEDESLKKQKESYAIRKIGIVLWHKLAKDKMENQDAYLRAIDTEKEAFETRLDAAMLNRVKSKKAVAAEDSQEDNTSSLLPNEKKKNPYQGHKELIRQLQDQKAAQFAKQIEAENNSQFSEKLIGAARILLKAQMADLKLAEREGGIARDQVTVCKTDKDWKRQWESIHKKVDRKLKILEKVYDDQRGVISSLKAEKAYFDALIEIKSERVKTIEDEIASEKKNVFKAALLTAKNIALRKGLIILGYLFGAYILILFIKKAGRIAVQKASDDDDDTLTDMEQRTDTLVSVFSGIGRFAVGVIIFLLLLDTLGVNIGPLMGAFAIFGLAISFGSQSLVKDLVTGFFILLEHQLSVGDFVDLSGISGTVEKISLRRVVLRDAAGTVHSVPNGEISSVSNKSHGWARAIVHVGVGYGDDLRKVREVFDEVGRKMYEEPEWNDKLTEPPYFVGVTELGDSAVVVRVWAKTRIHEQWGIERELNLRLKLAADEAGIEIPFPQTVVTMAKIE